MKKTMSELRQKEVKELIKEKEKLAQEIGKLSLEHNTNPAKDTNMIYKKKKKLAQILTIIKENNK